MHIKKSGDIHIMSEGIYCTRFFHADTKHIIPKMTKINDTTYKCEECGQVIEIESCGVIQDEKGRLKMEARVREVPNEL
jgi:recombinational DNA repair protein RecR